MRKSTQAEANPDMRDWRFAHGLAPKPVARCPDCGCEHKGRCRQPEARAVVAAWVRVLRRAIEEARA